MSDMSGEFLESVQASKPEPETTSEQLAEIEGQATEFTPPEGWRLLPIGEVLREGDFSVRADGHWCLTERVGSTVGANQRYIRRIEPEPEPQPKPQPVQVCEGRWRTRGEQEVRVTAMPTDHEDFSAAYPWWDGDVTTWTSDGVFFSGQTAAKDLVTYLGPIETERQRQPQPQPQAETDDELRIRLLKEVNNNQAETIADLRQQLAVAKTMLTGVTQGREHAEANRRRADTIIAELQNRIADLETINAAQEAAVQEKNAKLRERADEFRSEVSYVQNLLGTERRRVGELETLVRDLRTINAAQEQANDDLQNRLKAVAAEWAEQAETSRRLQKELDAAQQVPADSPELRQANEKLAQLEALQPMAAACSTAQTMVRDMLGHMRCLLALHHTTDRRSFCTLLESILEVFDDAECDDDDDGDETGDAEQADHGVQ